MPTLLLTLLCAPMAEAAAPKPLPLPASGPPAWTDTRGALAEGDWQGALEAAQDTLREDGDHAAAKFVEGYALHKLGRYEQGISVMQQVADDEDVGELARKQVALYDHRWRRDQPSLSLGLSLNDDRGAHPRGLRPAFSAEIEAPVVWRFNVRADVTTPWRTEDQLDAKGPVVSLMAVYHQPIGIWAADLAVGPSLWTGPTGFWDGGVSGPFPGLRIAGGGSVRLLKNLGLRAESGWSAHRGTHALLNDWSRGFDVRVMATGYVW